MERNHVLGLVCGYFLSRFDERAYARLGYSTKKATHLALGRALGVSPNTIKNWRDEFDPIHQNSRQGWHKREMWPSRRRIVEALAHLSEEELSQLVVKISDSPMGDLAVEFSKNLGELDIIGAAEDVAFGLRGPTGIKAENVFLKYHEESQRPVPGNLMDRRHDDCGFDFEIVTRSGKVAVEVKGLAGAAGGITFTNKEWQKAQALGESYYLALVRRVATEPEVSIIRNPARRFDARMRTYTTVQVCWSVGQSVLRGIE